MNPLLFAMALLFLGATSPAAEEGRREAHADIRAGRLILRNYGFAAGVVGPYAQLLKERFGVQQRAVAGCVIDAELAAETRAYNDVMKAEIEKRFGAGVLETLRKEAARK
jgi:hypothetical protein